MEKYTVEVEHLQAFLKYLDDTYTKESPFRDALVKKINYAILNADDIMAELELDEGDADQAVAMLQEIEDDDFDGKWPGAENVATVYYCQKMIEMGEGK